MGYTTRALKMIHDVFVCMPRKRLFILGFSEDVGGKAAADAAVKAVISVLDALPKTGIPGVWDVIDPNDQVEIQRISGNKASR